MGSRSSVDVIAALVVLAACGAPLDPATGDDGGGGGADSGATSDAPGAAVDADTAPGAARQQVLDYLRGISGTRTVAGIHNRYNTAPGQFTGQIHDTTGMYPGLWSGDFLFEPEHIAARPQMIAQAKVEWSHGALVNIMYHACPPTQGEACDWDGGLLSHLSDAQWADLIADGGTLNAVWKARLDRIAPFLRELQDAGIAPLFRPLHEMNQGAFWWGGRPGAQGTRRLYQLTHDYLVETHGLDQLVWVWDVQDLSWDFDAYNPGAAYYDVAALDVYGDGFTTAKYDALRAAAGDKVIAIGECARLPTAAELAAQPAWTFFMSWSELTFADNSAREIGDLYGAPRVITLDEMPGW